MASYDSILNEAEKKTVEGITIIEEAWAVLEKMKRRVDNIREYTYRTPPVCLLAEAETALQSDDLTEEVKIMFVKTLIKTVMRYLKL